MSPSPSTNSLASLNPSSKRKKKRRRQPRGCRAEFDYTGWEHYNQWRRETSLLKSESRAQHNPHFIPPLKIGKDCYRDCDFPSECQTLHLRSAVPSSTRKKSEPELIFPISPISPEERQRIDDEREDQQLIFDIAATTPPATRASKEPHSSSNLIPVISSPNLSILVERERRKSLEAEKRGLEHEAQFIVSPLTSHTAFADIVYGSKGSSSPKGKEREDEGHEDWDETNTEALDDLNPPDMDNLGEEETEEDEKGYVREFIRVKKRKSIAKIEQLTGLRLSEVQYGKMVGEVVDGDLEGSGIREREGSISRRASVEIESPPSSPLKMFYTVEDSDEEDEVSEIPSWDGQ
ncbi:hypothetical protein sscle_01g003950 [Sclerotinia sclerotiorum 1980 UF-70]|uniref:Uncharacterized protein n=1 Tax=Sclerotinia sclerotiorum (strain ATCC 18683 / 1980 / Ss-1) TaxID=665079 RepID=A0A1D9PSB9_SCLS1|nr:hypothetical protein sscle_01g003950 [Sclerotinia sclerotiorum 1980 UF-70]